MSEQPHSPFVVAGLDGSDRDSAVAAWAAREAQSRGASLVLITVQEIPMEALPYAPQLRALYDDHSGETFERGLAAARSAVPGISVSTSDLFGRAENVLLDASQKAELVVVGTGRRSGMDQFFFGTVSLNVAAHAHCPVAVVPEDTGASLQRIVVGVDGVQSRGAVAVALEMGRRHSAQVELLTSWSVSMVGGYVVTEPDSPEWREVEDGFLATQREVIDGLGEAAAGVDVAFRVAHGGPTAVLAEATKSADLLVMGNRGRGGFTGKLLGSVTMRLLQQTHCPMVVVRHSKD